MELPFLPELIQYIRNIMDDVQSLTELSSGKFSDRRFGELFKRIISKNVEESDLILNGFLKYIEITNPVRKKGTVNALFEEGLNKYYAQLEENRVKVIKSLEEDLPETIVPDEQLRFVFDSLLQYAVISVLPLGSINLATKSLSFQKEARKDGPFVKQNENYIEIVLTLNGYKIRNGKIVGELITLTAQKENGLDLLLRLVDSIVRGNQGVMEIQVDEIKARKSISLRFPVERRKGVIYQFKDEGYKKKAI